MTVVATSGATSVPTITDIEQAVGFPTPAWVGRCNFVCWFAVHRGAVPADSAVVLGHWHGDLHPDSWFVLDREILGRVRHAWIELSDGSIIDPTRWAFDRPREPYVWRGDAGNEYVRGPWPLRAEALA